VVNERKEKTGIEEYSEALDSIFSNNLTAGVVIHFESGGYALCVEIKNGKTEIIFYKL
jgi:hypothetical protein